MEDYLSKLNEQQRAAVEYLDGPELVIAGAGSGKTRVLTYKLVHLLAHDYEPWRLLALTFTNKAAREMRERIEKLVGAKTSSRLWMGTFHSIFSRILHIHADRVGFSSNFTIYDSSDSKSLVKMIIRDMQLDDKVCDVRYRGIVSFLLGNVAVFDSIDAASEAVKKSRYSIRIVTLDGQQINPGGSYTGGSARRDSGMITRKNTIDKLKAQSDDIAGKLAENSAHLAGLSGELDELKNFRADAEERIKIFEALKKTELVDIEESAARCDVLSGFIEQLRSDMTRLDEKEQSGAKDLERLNAESEKLSSDIEQLSSLRAEKASISHDIESEIESADTLIGTLTVRIAELRKDTEGAVAAISEISERIAGYNESAQAHREKVARIIESISQAENMIKQKKTDAEAQKELLASKESRFGELEKDALDFEKKLGELNRKSREISSRKELVLEAHTKGENKLQNLQSEVEKTAVRIYDEYGLTHADALKLDYPEVTKENRSAVVQVLNDTKNAIRALGAVNVDAIEEYAELKTRYDGMKKQFDDLLASKEELNSLIASISGEMEVIFKDAFERINKNFGDVFKELFGGGHAELSLTDPEDVLNCGIEISAAPPGKLIKNLSLLSGGEQSFVAIALMFAMIKVNPAPFCIFDEIEAALDEVNVNRFASFASTFSKDIQIILITHRRGTMEIADTLYGVTMPNHGVSKVFTLDVTSVSKQKFAEENL